MKKKKNKLTQGQISEVIIYPIVLIVIIICSFLDENFLSFRNLYNILLSSIPLLLVAFAQMIVMLGAGLDLSIGGIVSLTNVLFVHFVDADSNIGFVLPLVLSLFSGIICGFINGFLITKGRLSSVITTIATSSIFSGLALAIRPIPGGKVHRVFAKFIMGQNGIPFPILLIFSGIIIMAYITTWSKFGKHLRAVGGNAEAAYSVGISVNTIHNLSFVISGIISALAGIFLSAQMTSGDATVGDSYTMNSITIAVIGGTSFTGAIGNVGGLFAGSILLMTINNILNLTGVSPFYQFIFQGGILIIALAVGSIQMKRK
jgi:ribose transport system permease protein